MKPTYATIALQPGTHQAGIVSIQVAPKEWLDNILVQDFATKNVATLPLKAGKTLISLDFIYPSYEYTEKPKTSKNGAFTEVTLSGLLNYTSPDAAASLETLKYHELIAVVTDNRRQRRIVGDKDFGLTCSFFSKNGNTANASHATEVVMTIEVEEVPPFYSGMLTGYYWYGNTNPFAKLSNGIDDFTFQTSKLFAQNSNIEFTLPTAGAIDMYALIKVPIVEPLKTTWYNTDFNKGTIGDSVFALPITIGAYRYYYTKQAYTYSFLNTLILS